MIVTSESIILDFFGRPVMAPADAPGLDNRAPVPLTLGYVCLFALQLMAPGEDIPLAAKVERFKLAVRLARGGDVSLTAEDVALLKRLIGKAWAPLVVGRALEVLDPAALGPVPASA
jgi:hypothetical protein